MKHQKSFAEILGYVVVFLYFLGWLSGTPQPIEKLLAGLVLVIGGRVLRALVPPKAFH